MALKPCIAATTDLADEDVSAVLDNFDEYQGAMPQADAAAMAVDDTIESLKVEQAEYRAIIDRTFPELAAKRAKRAKPKMLAQRGVVKPKKKQPAQAKRAPRPPAAPGVMIRDGKVVMAGSEYQFAQPYDFVQHSPRLKSAPKTFIHKEALEATIAHLQEEFPGLKKAQFHVFETQDDAFGEGSVEEHGIIHGGYYAGTNEIVLIAEHIKNENALIGTIRHESVGHFGFRELLGEQFDKLLLRIYGSRKGELKDAYQWVAKYYPDLVAKENGGTAEKDDIRTIADEMLARSAETMSTAGIVRRVYDQIIKLLNQFGLARGTVSYNEMHALVRSSEANLRRKYRVSETTAPPKRPMLAQRGGPKPIWISGLKTAVEGIQQKKGSGDQFLGMIRKKNKKTGEYSYMAGVKEDEFEWLGLEEFLAGREKVTRDEIVEFIDGNGVQIEDVIFGRHPVAEVPRGPSFNDVVTGLNQGVGPVVPVAAPQPIFLDGWRFELMPTGVVTDGDQTWPTLQEYIVANYVGGLGDGRPTNPDDWSLEEQQEIANLVNGIRWMEYAGYPPEYREMDAVGLYNELIMEEGFYFTVDHEDFGPFETMREAEQKNFLEWIDYAIEVGSHDETDPMELLQGQPVEETALAPTPESNTYRGEPQHPGSQLHGGQNYKEILLTLPTIGGPQNRAAQQRPGLPDAAPLDPADYRGNDYGNDDAFENYPIPADGFNVNTDAGIEQYVRWLIQNNMTYHFDDNPVGIAWGANANATPANIAVVEQMHDRLPDMWDWFEDRQDMYEAYGGNGELPAPTTVLTTEQAQDMSLEGQPFYFVSTDLADETGPFTVWIGGENSAQDYDDYKNDVQDGTGYFTTEDPLPPATTWSGKFIIQDTDNLDDVLTDLVNGFEDDDIVTDHFEVDYGRQTDDLYGEIIAFDDITSAQYELFKALAETYGARIQLSQRPRGALLPPGFQGVPNDRPAVYIYPNNAYMHRENGEYHAIMFHEYIDTPDRAEAEAWLATRFWDELQGEEGAEFPGTEIALGGAPRELTVAQAEAEMGADLGIEDPYETGQPVQPPAARPAPAPVHRQENFTSGHFGHVQNILGWGRINDRTVNGEKVLFIEEIQSDWHQQGRRRGYKGRPASPANVKKILFEMFGQTGLDQFQLHGPMLVDHFNDSTSNRVDLREIAGWRDEDIQRFYERAVTYGQNAVTDAPFKKTWPLLVMKRLIRYASEHGYDRISWTTGAQQADRYSMAQDITKIEVIPDETGTYSVIGYQGTYQAFRRVDVAPDSLADLITEDLANQVFEDADMKESLAAASKEMKRLDKAFNKIIDKLKPDSIGRAEWRLSAFMAIRDRDATSNARAANNRNPGWYSRLTQAQRDELIKIQEDRDEAFIEWVGIEDGVRTFDGLNIDIGGHGMRGFYDKMLTSISNKYLKKWGIKVGEFPLRDTPKPIPARNPLQLPRQRIAGVVQLTEQQRVQLGEIERIVEADGLEHSLETAIEEFRLVPTVESQRSMMEAAAETGDYYDQLDAIVGFNEQPAMVPRATTYRIPFDATETDGMFLELLGDMYYEWGVDQGLIDPTEDGGSDAEELLLRGDLTDEQRRWLTDFVDKWGIMQRIDDMPGYEDTGPFSISTLVNLHHSFAQNTGQGLEDEQIAFLLDPANPDDIENALDDWEARMNIEVDQVRRELGLETTTHPFTETHREQLIALRPDITTYLWDERQIYDGTAELDYGFYLPVERFNEDRGTWERGTLDVSVNAAVDHAGAVERAEDSDRHEWVPIIKDQYDQLTNEQLLAMNSWNDRNGDFEDLGRHHLLAIARGFDAEDNSPGDLYTSWVERAGLPEGWEVVDIGEIDGGDGDPINWRLDSRFAVLDTRTDIVGEGATRFEAVHNAQNAIGPLARATMVPPVGNPIRGRTTLEQRLYEGQQNQMLIMPGEDGGWHIMQAGVAISPQFEAMGEALAWMEDRRTAEANPVQALPLPAQPRVVPAEEALEIQEAIRSFMNGGLNIDEMNEYFNVDFLNEDNWDDFIPYADQGATDAELFEIDLMNAYDALLQGEADAMQPPTNQPAAEEPNIPVADMQAAANQEMAELQRLGQRWLQDEEEDFAGTQQLQEDFILHAQNAFNLDLGPDGDIQSEHDLDPHQAFDYVINLAESTLATPAMRPETVVRLMDEHLDVEVWNFDQAAIFGLDPHQTVVEHMPEGWDELGEEEGAWAVTDGEGYIHERGFDTEQEAIAVRDRMVAGDQDGAHHWIIPIEIANGQQGNLEVFMEAAVVEEYEFTDIGDGPVGIDAQAQQIAHASAIANQQMQHSFPISAELRDAAMSGQMLFRRDDSPGPQNLEKSFKLSRESHFKNIRELKVKLQALAKESELDLTVPTEQLAANLIDIGTQDAIYALKDNANAVGWYDKTVTKAIEVLSLMHPELKTDENARFAFTYALAVTSNGMKVDRNFQMAEKAYNYWKTPRWVGKTYGSFMPTPDGVIVDVVKLAEPGKAVESDAVGEGTSAGMINKHMALFNFMVERHGIDNFREFMLKETTVAAIQSIDNLKVAGELVNTRVIGAAILGPKIGNGFFANLNGMFDKLTMDRWLMRTWGRWTGTLLDDNKKKIRDKTTKLRALVKLMSADEKRSLGRIIGTSVNGKADVIALKVQKIGMKKLNRDAMSGVGVIADDKVQAELTAIFGPAKKGVVRKSLGDELRKVSNGLAKDVDGQKEAPANGTERNWMRHIFTGILEEMQRKGYNEMTMADLQALAWYPEKKLYDSAKSKDDIDEGYEDDEAPDYANAAVKLATENGIKKGDIDKALKRAEKAHVRKVSAAGAGTSTSVQSDTQGQAGNEGSAGGWVFRRSDQEESPEFKEWAGTDRPVIQPYAINDTDFSKPGPYILRVFHGTTHDFDTFDATIGNMLSQFGRMTYLTSDSGDAGMNYAGEGPDLSSRINARASDISEELAEMDREELVELAAEYDEVTEETIDDYLAYAMARKELHGDDPKVLELFVRTDKPFIVGADDSPWIQFIDYDANRNEATEMLASDEGIDVEEIRENPEQWDQRIDEYLWDIEANQPNPLVEAINTIARRYDFDVAPFLEDVMDYTFEGTRHSRLERAIRESDQIWEARDDEGEMATMQVIAEIIQELGFDSIILKNAGDRFNGMGIAPETAHVQIFDANKTNIKSANENSGAFDANDPRFRFRKFIDGLNNAPTDGNLGMPEETLKQRFVRLAQDGFNRVKQLQSEIQKQGGTVNYKSDVYRAEELSSSKITHRLKLLQREYMDPLLELMEKEEITVEELDLYLIANHAHERNATVAERNDDMPDGGSGMTNAHASELLAALPADRRRVLDRAAALVYGVNNQHLDDLVEGGHLDQGVADGLINRWNNYVPLKGKDGQQFDPSKSKGSGYAITGTGITWAKGRGAGNLPESPTAHSFAQAEEAIVRTEKTRVGQALIQLVRDNPNPEFWTITSRNFKKFEDTFGEPFEGYDEPPEGLVLDLDYHRVKTSGGKVAYRLNPGYKNQDDVFPVMVDGTELLVQIKDEVVIEQLKKMNVTQLNALLAGAGKVNRYLAMINTALNPEFVITNFERDFQTAMINLGGEHSAAIAGKVAAGIPGAIRGIWQATFETKGQSEWRDLFNEMEKEGGTIGFFGLEDIDTKVKLMQKKLAGHHGVLGHSLKTITTIRDVVLDANLSVENAARLSAYKVIRDEAIANGLSVVEAKQKAASVAKNLTVNFNRKGELAPLFNSAYLFYNASIQGSARIITALGNPRVRKIATGVAAVAWMLSMYNRMAGGDDEDGIPYWDKISDYTKQTNMIIMHPDGSGEYTKIRLPYGYNVFWYTGVATHDLAFDPRKDVVDTGMNLLSATLNAFNPIQGADLLDTVVPTILKPAEQHIRNINFMGAPLKPENPFDNYDRPDSQKAFKSTNPMLKDLMVAINEVGFGNGRLAGGNETHAGVIDWSPEIIKHYTSWLTGGAGMTGWRAVDTAINVAAGQELEGRNVPFVRTVTGSPGSHYDRERYYNAIKSVNAVEKQLDIYGRGTSERQEYLDENRDVHNLALHLTSYKNQIKRLSQARDAAYAEDDYDTANEKREEIRVKMMEFSLRYDEAVEDTKPKMSVE